MMHPTLEALTKARRSLNAPKDKAQALRRAQLYERVSGEGPARQIAAAEAQRQRAFAVTGKYGRGNTAGRAELEAARTGSRKPGQPISPRYRGKRDGDLNNDGKLDNQPKPRKPASKTADDLDPSSPNYRYKDTGYVGGSRKEIAADVIRRSGRDGQRLRATDIDWKSLEENPREAAAVITKSNLFGQVDWAKHRAEGMEPGAGFLIDRVYASVGKAPVGETPLARKDYALALETLRDRLEKAKTPDQVDSVLGEIRDEMRGRVLNAAESDKVAALAARSRDLQELIRPLRQELDASYKLWIRAQAENNQFKYEADKRTRRGWKPDPEIEASLAAAKQSAEKLNADYVNARDRIYPRIKALEDQYRATAMEARTIEADAVKRNQTDNDMVRAWSQLGPRFAGVANFRGHKGSETFRNHVATAKIGKVKDWSWADQETITTTKERKESVRFQLLVADDHTRIGGRPVDVSSTSDLKKRFNLREVQSGNWVLRDVAAAKFHTEQTAGALSDLADVIGAPDGEVSLNGRVAIAFGARGKGNAGGTTARAHYESVQRVINLTKMSGGGTLAHEWFHALDNLVAEMQTGRPGKASDWATETKDILGDPELYGAFRSLGQAMMDGDLQGTRRFAYTANDIRLAAANVAPSKYGLGGKISTAGDAASAIKLVEAAFPPSSLSRRGMKKRRDQWFGIAAAYYGRNADGGTIEVPFGPTKSSFKIEALRLDANEGTSKYYWAQPKEMAARAFQSWVEDRLSAQGRRNDYLSAKADNKYYAMQEVKPFPEGAERERINRAFDELFAVLRKRGTLRKALEQGRRKEAMHPLLSEAVAKARIGKSVAATASVQRHVARIDALITKARYGGPGFEIEPPYTPPGYKVRGPHLKRPTRPPAGARAADAPSLRDLAAALRDLADKGRGKVKKALRQPYRTARSTSLRGLGGQRYRLIAGRARDGKQRWNWGPVGASPR